MLGISGLCGGGRGSTTRRAWDVAPGKLAMNSMLSQGFGVDLMKYWPDPKKTSVMFEVLEAAPVENKRCVICSGPGKWNRKKGVCHKPGEMGHLQFLEVEIDSEEEAEIDQNRSPFILNVGDAWVLNAINNPELASKPIYDPQRPASLAKAFWCKLARPNKPICLIR